MTILPTIDLDQQLGASATLYRVQTPAFGEVADDVNMRGHYSLPLNWREAMQMKANNPACVIRPIHEGRGTR
jgi:hypothetical protein